MYQSNLLCIQLQETRYAAANARVYPCPWSSESAKPRWLRPSIDTHP